jgi:hypothetical protein
LEAADKLLFNLLRASDRELSCDERDVSENPRPVSRFRLPILTFQTHEQIPWKNILWIQLHRKLLLHRIWHCECSHAMEGEKHNDQRSRHNQPREGFDGSMDFACLTAQGAGRLIWRPVESRST